MTESRKELVFGVIVALLVLAICLGLPALYRYLDDDRNFGSGVYSSSVSLDP